MPDCLYIYRHGFRWSKTMRFAHFAVAFLLLLGSVALFSVGMKHASAQSKPAVKVSIEEINRLVDQLGDNAFPTRSLARRKLEAIGEPAIEILKKAAENADDFE